MNGKKAKEIRRGLNDLLESNQAKFPKEVRVMPWGQEVSPRRALYRRFKQVIGRLPIVRGRIRGEVVRLQAEV